NTSPTKAFLSVDFSTDDALESLGSSVGTEPNMVAEYDENRYTDIYVSDWVVEEAGRDGGYDEQRDKVSRILQLDLIDGSSYRDIIPRAGNTRFLITRTENVLLVRCFGQEGVLFVSVDDSSSIDDTVSCMERLTGASEG
ncbi:MAG: hypothetical protein SV760_01730, partial [Halobacteria archaeon]|nr:hypothetical protein [Halobacteria archaeon]